MTIGEVKAFVNRVKKNSYTQDNKLITEWLNDVDTALHKSIISNYEGSADFSGYDENTDLDTQLLCEQPYDEMYKYFVMAQIDFLNREMTSFENNITQYNNLVEAFRNHFNKTHIWKKRTKIKYY